MVTITWGWSFVWIKQALNEVESQLGADHGLVAAGLFVGLRFGVAAVLLPLLVPAARRGLNATAWRAGLLLSLLLLGGFFLQMLALQEMSPAVSAFLTSLYVVFTALLERCTRGVRHGRTLLLGVLLATVGAGFISGPPQLHFNAPEWMTVLCALLFATHILATDHYTRRASPMAITTTSFVWVTLGSFLALLLGMGADGAPTWSEAATVAWSPGFLHPLLLCSFLATLLALSLMNQFQRVIEPVRAAVLYSLEPVWAAIIAVLLGMSVVDSWLILGGGALITGNLVAEIRTARPSD